ATSTDQTKQKQAIYGLEKIMVDSLPSIPLVYGATWYEYTTTHFTGWPDKDNPYATPSPYTYPDAEVVILNLKPV
ncbi:MAG TPA: ABC transporter substrate-binding protein, partial [Ktedonobacteraceae bacterium]|nr:ABC transporter substrate-binding protein [Ktedonobacteraceae bacterium]